MNRICLFSLVSLLAWSGAASWYWPFGSSDEGDENQPRLSELMEPASLLIDEASDLASEGKSSDAIAKYRGALKELDRIEAENPERSKRPEFATLRNKRAYVNAAIDSLLMAQVRDNARAVAVSDTTELERRLAEEKAAQKAEKKAEKKGTEAGKKAEKKGTEAGKKAEKRAEPKEPEAKKPPAQPSATRSRREQAMASLSRGDYAAAAVAIEEMLVAKPNDVAALNLRAAMEAAQGDFKAAEATLDQAIMSHPRNHFAYYNMARLVLQTNPEGKSSAKRYYETGRALGGPVDSALEVKLK